MSEQKQAHVVASVDKGIVVGTRHSRHYRTHIKVWLIIISTIIVVVIIGLGGYKILHHHDKNVNKVAVYVSPHFSTLTAAEQAATSASTNGQFSHALVILQSVIGMASTKQEKSDLYAQLASAAQNTGNVSLAIQYYQKRHATDPSTTAIDSYSLAGLYERAGEDTQAITQYQTYINYIQANPGAVAPYSASSVIAPINTQIQSLENKK